MRSRVSPVSWLKVREGAAIVVGAWGVISLLCVVYLVMSAPTAASTLVVTLGAGVLALATARRLWRA